MPQVITWVDNLKAICIFLVVYGHFANLDPSLKAIIYSIHLPAFLMITGYLSLSTLQQSSPHKLVKNQLLYYLVLYGLFTLASSFLWYLLEARDQSFTLVIKPLIGGLGGLHGPSLALIHNNDPLWYFPFLITSLLVAFILFHLSWIWRSLFFIASLMAYQLNLLPPLFWSLDLAPVGAMFILFGAALRHCENTSRYAFIGSQQMGWIISLLILWLLLVWINDGINMNSRNWGNSWIVFMLTAIVGTACMVGISKKIPSFKFLRSVSQHTLIIFCVHIYFVKALNGVIAKLPAMYQGWAILVAAIVTLLICWMISLLGQPLLNKWFKPKPSASWALQKGGQ